MAHPATLRAVRASIEALGAPLDIGAVFSPKEGEERGYGIWQNRDLEPDEILSLIPRLAAQNVRGGNIFMRLGPGASKAHPGLVLLDDLSSDSVKRLSSAGFEPCLITETSPTNYQAWVRIIDGVIPYDTMRLVARHLAAEFDGDPRAVSPRQPGRVPGFTNRKLKHRRSDGNFPYVRVIDANPSCIASRGRDLITRLTSDTARRAAGALPETPRTAAKVTAYSNTSINGEAETELDKLYARAHAIIHAQIARGTRSAAAGSASEIDFLFARLAIKAGQKTEVIAAFIAIQRPDKSFNYPSATVRAATEYLSTKSPTTMSRLG